jgi:hypothetical protein
LGMQSRTWDSIGCPTNFLALLMSIRSVVTQN